jgi:hypothetical protein
MRPTCWSNIGMDTGVKPSGMGILRECKQVDRKVIKSELPDNVKPNLGCDAVISLPRDTEKSKLSIIKTTVYLKYVKKREERWLALI